jgi:hypothetical protein
MKNQYHILLQSIVYLLLLYDFALALPPQIDAANNMIKGNESLSSLYDISNGYIDKDGNFHLCFEDKESEYGRIIRYSSFGPDGQEVIDTKMPLRCDLYYCSFDFNMLSDQNHNLHIIYQEATHSGYEYIMLDDKGKAVKQLKIGDHSVIPGKMRIMPDGRLLIAAMRYIKHGNKYDVFFSLAPNAEKFDTVMIQMPQTNDYNDDQMAEFYPLDNNRILMVYPVINRLDGPPQWREAFLRKTIFNLKSREVEDFQYYPLRDSVNVIYTGIRPDIMFEGSVLAEMGDTLALMAYAPSIDIRSDTLQDSVCVLLFDKKGNLIPQKNLEYRKILYQNLDKTAPGDILIRENAAGPIQNRKMNWLSLFGLFSLRNYPDLIIDLPEK